jgi:putative spermidine/putrescine transport system permease protein
MVANVYQDSQIPAKGTHRSLRDRGAGKARFRAAAMIAPLFLFVLLTFILPIGQLLFRSVSDPLVNTYWSKTAAVLTDWDGTGLPPEAAFSTIRGDIQQSDANDMLGPIAIRLNYELPGFRTLLNKTGRMADQLQAPFSASMVKLDPRWGDSKVWQVIKRAGHPYTIGNYLAALDLTYDANGKIVRVPETKRIYVPLFLRTLWVSLAITAICLILGYPVAYLLANSRPTVSRLLMLLVLLPFWTSLLVRTTAWIALLQDRGVVNDILVKLGIIDDGNRLTMIFNMQGTIIVMVHILLPLTILPIYSLMKGISPNYMRAAKSLGAYPARAFIQVYLPQTLPAVRSASVLVFILAVGYYITPALVGGRTGQLVSNFIAYHMQSSLNWGLAAALSGILLGGVLLLYALYSVLFPADELRSR